MGQITDLAAARIRTIVPTALGLLAAWILTQTWADPIKTAVAALGVEVDASTLTWALGTVLAAAVYTGATWLERRPGTGRSARAARLIGRLLIALGLHIGPPAYPTTRARRPD